MTKTKILNAAAELFADKGFNGTKVQEIADAAGVNKAMLYYYSSFAPLLGGFGGKKSIRMAKKMVKGTRICGI